MPFPQQVINQLSQEPAKTPGWSFNILAFSAGVFVIALGTYAGLTFGYEPYLRNQTNDFEGQVAKLAQSISSDDETKLAVFYSQISNLRSLLRNHVAFSGFLQWLERHTEANVYYSQLTFSSGNQVALTGLAKTEADVNEQIAVFEGAPEAKSVSVSNVTYIANAGLWQFAAAILMDPSVFASSFPTSFSPASPSAPSSTTAATPPQSSP